MKSKTIINAAFILLVNLVLVKSIYVINATETDNEKKIEENPAVWTEAGIWGSLLEEYIFKNHRETRVMRIPISENFIEKNDTAYNITKTIRDDKKTKLTKINTNTGKIVVNTSNQSNRKPTAGAQVSETDLYLLSAIEKLVYRVDFMEKRLRKAEEMLYYVTAGNRMDQDPCPDNFTRIGATCYFFSTSAGREMDWKAASKHCRKLRAVLAEMETIEENQDVIAYLQNNAYLRGRDYWTGGLNPGLLWIWSNSARPVADENAANKDKNKKPASILGDGRCLRLAYNPALRSYSYRGSDCGTRFSYMCEIADSTTSNQISRLGKSRKIFNDEL